MESPRAYRTRKYEFGQRLYEFRKHLALTQAELAEQLGVHWRTVQNWETGEYYPKALVLQHLIVICLRHQLFTPGNESTEARAFWQLAIDDKPHANALFDESWFARALAETSEEAAASRSTALERSSDALPPTAATDRGVQAEWEETRTIPQFFGREQELATLHQWITQDRCRLVAILGLGGLGKSSLATTFAQRAGGDFDVVFSLSLQNAPPASQILDQVIQRISVQQLIPPESFADKIAQVVQLFRQSRCLLILDNFDTLLQPETLTGTYRTGFADYGLLLQALSEREHNSCLLLTTREKPVELGPREGRNSPVRTMKLTGVSEEACRVILEAHDVFASPEEAKQLAYLYGGNPLALNLMAEPIRELFGGNVREFLSSGQIFFHDLTKLMELQCSRTTPLEKIVLYWLAMEREFVPLHTLIANIEGISQRDVLVSLESLQRRMQIERSPSHAAFTLQPVILEFVTGQLIKAVYQEIVEGQPKFLQSNPLMQATAKEYIRRTQEELIAKPLLARLLITCRTNSGVEEKFSEQLARWRGQPHARQGYGPGNIANLLRVLRGDLKGQNLAGLYLRQIYLQGIAAQDTTLAHSHLTHSILQEPFGGIASVACSPDMRYMAVGTMNGEVRLWEVADRKVLLAAHAHIGIVCGLAFSADGQLLASSSTDGLVYLWRVEGDTPLARLEHHKILYGLALSADGRLLACGGGDGTVTLWDVSNPAACRQLCVLREHTRAVWGLAFSTEGQLLASSSFDGTVRLWNVAENLQETTEIRSLAMLNEHTAGVYSVAFSASGEFLASSSHDATIRVWDVETVRQGDGQRPACMAVLRGHSSSIRSVAISDDGTRLTSGSDDGTIRLWAIGAQHKGEKCLAVLKGHDGAVWGVAMSADGKSVISGGTDGSIRLWDGGNPHGNMNLAIVHGATDAVNSLALSPDGQLLATGSNSGKVRLYRLGDSQTVLDAVSEAVNVAVLQGHTNMVMSVAFSPDGRILASGSGDSTIRLWAVDDVWDGDGKVSVLKGKLSMVMSVAFTPDGQQLISGSSDGSVHLWDVRNPHGRSITTTVLDGHTNAARGVCVSADGRLLATCSFDETICLWNLTETNPSRLKLLRGHHAGVYSVSFSASGDLLASCSFDGTVKLWNVATGACMRTLEGHVSPVWSVTLSQNGAMVASAGSDHTVRLWDCTTGNCLAILRGHTGGVWGVAFSADGTFVASGSTDGTVRLWDCHRATHLRTLRAERVYEKMDITGLTGITEAQRTSLLAMGAVEHGQPEKQVRNGQ